jgi:HEAT repeat protein
MTEIEIRDPDPDPSDPARTSVSTAEPGPESPYKNLLVPLVVVPALIVMVLVLVFVLFGAVAGKEDSPRDNLDRLLNGGVNERKQAAFNLVRQVLEFRQASADGEPPEWDIDASFLPELTAAREQVPRIEGPRDVAIPLVLSSLLAQLGEPAGVDQLAELTRLDDALDPEHEYRMYAAMTLGSIGPALAPPERDVAARSLIRLLDGEDAGLALVAIAGLQNLPSDATVPALERMLERSALEQRASAALSLAALGDDSGVPVLIEALTLPPYEAERAADSTARKWPPQRVSESRVKALEALVALGAAPPPDALRALADSDPDAALRAAILRVLGDGGE